MTGPDRNQGGSRRREALRALAADITADMPPDKIVNTREDESLDVDYYAPKIAAAEAQTQAGCGGWVIDYAFDVPALAAEVRVLRARVADAEATLSRVRALADPVTAGERRYPERIAQRGITVGDVLAALAGES